MAKKRKKTPKVKVVLVEKKIKAKRGRPRKISTRIKKTSIRKTKKTNYTRLFLIIFLTFFVIVFFFLSGRVKLSNYTSPSPIIHLIASISAQKKSIKIDPEFSYAGTAQKEENVSPIRIVIPKANIDVKIIDSEIINGYWQTATDSASFGLGSAYPNQLGNTVVFAHALPGMFENLKLLKEKTPIYLFTKSDWYGYEVEEIKTVLPNQTEVVSPTKEKQLTLYTCSGYNDAFRLVVIAKPADK